MKQQDVKLVVEFTEGYQKRYTEACCRRLEKLERRQDASSPVMAEGAKTAMRKEAV